MAKVPTTSLEIDDNGLARVYLAWALKPGQPQIVAICTRRRHAEKYSEYVRQHHPGAKFMVEPAFLNHLFGGNDVQSAIYAAANKK